MMAPPQTSFFLIIAYDTAKMTGVRLINTLCVCWLGEFSSKVQLQARMRFLKYLHKT
jgi:hypothetical protein